jgi:hypothetical protein
VVTAYEISPATTAVPLPERGEADLERLGDGWQHASTATLVEVGTGIRMAVVRDLGDTWLSQPDLAGIGATPPASGP